MAAMHHPYDPADVRSREYNMHSLHGHMISVASYNALLEVRGRDKPGPRGCLARTSTMSYGLCSRLLTVPHSVPREVPKLPKPLLNEVPLNYL